MTVDAPVCCRALVSWLSALPGAHWAARATCAVPSHCEMTAAWRIWACGAAHQEHARSVGGDRCLFDITLLVQ